MTTGTEKEDVVVAAPADGEVVVEGSPIIEGAPTQEEADYEKLFNEQVAKRQRERDGVVGEVVDPPEGEAVVDAADAGEGTGVVTPAADVVKKEDAPKVVAKAPARVDYSAIIASLPEAQRPAAQAAFDEAEALRTKNASLEHDNRSIAGRMSAYQRKYEEAAGKKPVDVAKAATAEQTAKWKQFSEDYPDIAEAFEARLDAVQPGKSADVEAMAKFVEDEMRTRFLTEAGDAVEVVHKGWRETVKTQAYKDWQATSETYERLASSDNIADAIALFDLYDAHRSKNAPATPVVDPKVAADAVKLAARRGAQAEGGKAAVTNTATPNHGVDTNDADQLFNFYANKANARMAKRNQ